MGETKENLKQNEEILVENNIIRVLDVIKKYQSVLLLVLTGGTTITLGVARFIYIAYTKGFNNYLRITSNFVKYDSNETIFYNIFISSVIALFFIFTTVLGYYFYKIRKFKKYFFIFNIIIFFAIFILGIFLSQDCRVYLSDIILLIICSLIIFITLHAFTIAVMLMPTLNLKLLRCKEKLKTLSQKEIKLKDNIKKFDKNSSRIRCKISKWRLNSINKNILATKQEIKSFEKKINIHQEKIIVEIEKISTKEAIMKVLIAMVVVIVVYSGISCLYGYFTAEAKVDFSTMTYQLVQINLNEEDIKEVDTYSVIYETDSYLIISPCYVENNILNIIINMQTKIDINDHQLYKHKYDKVVLKDAV